MFMKHLMISLMLLLTLAGPRTWANGDFSGINLRYVDSHGTRATGQYSSSLDQAVERVRRETGGRILSAETVRNNGERIHRIKVLTRDRRVKIIRIPASSN